jgi:hypothetical protein
MPEMPLDGQINSHTDRKIDPTKCDIDQMDLHPGHLERAGVTVLRDPLIF